MYFILCTSYFFLPPSQGVSGALAVLMKDAIKPTLMQTLEVRHTKLHLKSHYPSSTELLLVNIM